MRARAPFAPCAIALVVACGDATSPPPRAPIDAPTIAPQSFAPSPLLPRFSDPNRRAKIATAFPKLDALLEKERDAQNVPGLSFGVVIDGELAYEKSLGVLDLESGAKVTGDTVFRIGSITKTFTSLALLQLRDAGKLSLDDPMEKTIPELAAIRYPTHDSPRFTVRHALTHTTGLPPVGRFSYTEGDHDVTEKEMLGELDRIALDAAPGTRVAYSNFAMGLLGLVIGRTSGMRYRDYVNANVLAPLGMRSTFWDPADVPRERLASPYAPSPAGMKKVTRWRLGASESAGGMFSSLHDMARYAAFQLAAYPPRDDAESPPLRRSSVREAHALQRYGDLVVTREQDAIADARAQGIGLAWWTYESCDFENVVWHTGGADGYRGVVVLLPERGVGLVLLTNDVEVVSGKITDGALAMLRETGGLAPRALPVSSALAKAIESSVDLYAHYTDAKVEALLSAQLRAAVSNAAIVAQQDALHKAHGACTDPSPLIVRSAVSARFVVPCERGALEYELTVAEDGRLLAANVTPREPTTAAKNRCADRTPRSQ